MDILAQFSRPYVNVYDEDTSVIYTCPNCAEKLQIKFTDFERHHKSNFSNLKPEVFVGKEKGKDFLDFYCQKCSAPTTISFVLEAGGRHGECWYRITRAIISTPSILNKIRYFLKS